ncbi:MAG: YraN family protein [Lachnospiraceae bacterium]|nr:YraN family protein [Lachnospiraceae bacterium]
MNRRKTGKIYEELAAAYLERKGYRILKENYSNHFGEIDLIALFHPDRGLVENSSPEGLMLYPGSLLVFCEVKFRTHRGMGDPAEAVTLGKMRHICRTAVGFYLEQGLMDSFPCRFDVISILGNGEIRHIEDAFSLVL